MNIGMNPLVYKLWLSQSSISDLTKEYDALVENMTAAQNNDETDLVNHYATHINMVISEVQARDSWYIVAFYNDISY